MKNKESLLFELNKLKSKNIDISSIETIISNLNEEEIKRILQRECFKSEANSILSREIHLNENEKINYDYNTSFIGIPKYRGAYNGEFVYGDLLVKDNKTFIYKRSEEKYYEVDSDTIGTFTGFKDNNDTPLWTGDILTSKIEDNFEGIIVERTFVDLINWNRKKNCFVLENLSLGDIYAKTIETIDSDIIKNKKFKCTILDKKQLKELVKLSTISRMHVEKLQKLYYRNLLTGCIDENPVKSMI